MPPCYTIEFNNLEAAIAAVRAADLLGLHYSLSSAVALQTVYTEENGFEERAVDIWRLDLPEVSALED